ncbi:MAG: SsrA-binding protein SmpB [Bacteroidales bacterium]|nr:SsrA-binding protein SmpB [Bacteroidales bacterium]
MARKIDIVNRKIFREYELIERYTAGLQLVGTEIKSIRLGKATLSDAWCYFKSGELFVKGMNITRYEQGTHYNHVPDRDRKLLLTRHELRKLERKVRERGFTIVVIRLFITDAGYAKAEIALARGKAIYDKRQDIKRRDLDRETGRKFKS